MAEIASQPVENKKRKRTGKQREEAKKAAIQAKLDAENGAEAQAAGYDAETVVDQVDEAVQETPEAPAEPIVDYEKIAKRIPQALKTLHPIFKQAKTFEVRRLLKKLKFLRSKESSKEDLADLESQFTLLSHIALHPVAESHLLLKLTKHPKLKSTPLPASITSLLTSSDAPTSSGSQQVRAKVENRLCSSKAVADAVKSTLSWVVGEEGAKLGRPVKEKAVVGKLGAKGAQTVRKPDESDKESDDELVVPRSRATIAEEEDSDDELGMGDGAADEAGWESGSVDGGDARLAPASSDEESGGESDDESGSQSDASSVAVPAKRIKTMPSAKATKAAKAEMAKAVTSSMFLPSLSTGFTLGDSDSDPDLDPDVDGKGIVGRKGAPERKNRRGQRARQAIWEKKYGKGAKHVVKAREDEEKKEREKKWGKSDAGWGGKTGQSGELGHAGRGGAARGGLAARGARGGAVVGRGGFNGGRGGFAGGAAVSSVSASAPPAAAGGAHLHPSWEAARLRKQKEEALASAPKATKITFD